MPSSHAQSKLLNMKKYAFKTFDSVSFDTQSDGGTSNRAQNVKQLQSLQKRAEIVSMIRQEKTV